MIGNQMKMKEVREAVKKYLFYISAIKGFNPAPPPPLEFNGSRNFGRRKKKSNKERKEGEETENLELEKGVVCWIFQYS